MKRVGRGGRKSWKDRVELVVHGENRESRVDTPSVTVNAFQYKYLRSFGIFCGARDASCCSVCQEQPRPTHACLPLLADDHSIAPYMCACVRFSAVIACLRGEDEAAGFLYSFELWRTPTIRQS